MTINILGLGSTGENNQSTAEQTDFKMKQEIEWTFEKKQQQQEQDLQVPKPEIFFGAATHRYKDWRCLPTLLDCGHLTWGINFYVLCNSELIYFISVQNCFLMAWAFINVRDVVTIPRTEGKKNHVAFIFVLLNISSSQMTLRFQYNSPQQETQYSII